MGSEPEVTELGIMEPGATKRSAVKLDLFEVVAPLMFLCNSSNT